MNSTSIFKAVFYNICPISDPNHRTFALTGSGSGFLPGELNNPVLTGHSI